MILMVLTSSLRVASGLSINDSIDSSTYTKTSAFFNFSMSDGFNLKSCGEKLLSSNKSTSVSTIFNNIECIGFIVVTIFFSYP